MVDLDFSITDVEVERHAAAPHLRFALRVVNKTPDVEVLNVMLACQIRIEPTRRIYGPAAHDLLSDLFGPPAQWGQSLRSFLWTPANLLIPAFERESAVKLLVPCSFDFNVAATKYFHGVEDGDIPLNFLFSGSIFYRDDNGSLQIGQIAWSKESAYRLPVATWRSMMEHYYPQTAWICLGRDAFERLYRYKREKKLPSFERALDELMAAQTMGVES